MARNPMTAYPSILPNSLWEVVSVVSVLNGCFVHGLSVLQLFEDRCWSRGSFVNPPLIVSRTQTLPISLLWTLSALYTRWYQSFRFTLAQQTLPLKST